jgi:two-component sensor histidine kinase
MLDRVLHLTSQSRATWIYDNTFWDEAVTFVDDGGVDQAWVEEAFGGSLELVGADHLYVFDAQQRTLYATTREGEGGPLFRLDPAPLFGEQKIYSYFMWQSGEVYEVHSATIHPTADAEHAGVPHGVLAVVRRWDEEARAELADALGAEVSLVSNREPAPESTVDRVVVDAPLMGIDGLPAARIRASVSTPQLVAFADQRATAVQTGVLVVLMGTLGLGLAIHRWMIRPLDQFSQALSTRDAAPLSEIVRRQDEFGDLGRMLQESFYQNHLMAAEIGERMRAEATVTQSLREKEVLLREIHHRVKNNLQIISSLLMLQSEQMPTDEARGLLQESVFRVRSMALIHQQLYGVDSLERIELGDYAQVLVASLQSALAPRARVRVTAEALEVTVELAVPLGLILNELLTNAFKYGVDASVDPRRTGADPEGWDVGVEVRLVDGTLSIVVADHGAGLPDAFEPSRSASLGFQLVLALLQQIRGTLAWSNDGGARFEVRCPWSSGV